MATRRATTAVAAALAALAPLTLAMQPGAVPPVKAPMRPLQWGDINFLHTTDTHGWHGGHLQESQYSADWGDYVSFAHHLRQRADDDGVDLLVVDTGDRVEGNGLYDASSPKGKYTYDIFKQQEMDIICTGNHELYQATTADAEHNQTVPNYIDRYLASNLDYIDPKTGEQKPMAPQRYRAFTTKNQKIRVVAFGFLFDFTGNANNTVVQRVEKTVREPWFQKAIREEKADLFVVINHIGARMRELRVIYQAIRAQNPETPIALFAGHAHVRDAVLFDDKAFALASGRYLETIGWMSIKGVAGSGSTALPSSEKSAVTFQRRYIDNNLLGMYRHSGLNETTFPTDHGRNVSASITEAREELKLETLYGCAPRNYYLQRKPHDSPDSVFTLLRDRVIPEAIVRGDRADVPRLVILNTGAMRFDIFRGAFTRDSALIISPFISLIRYIPDVPYVQAKQVLRILNMQDRIVAAGAGGESGSLDWRQMNVPEQYSMKASEEDASLTNTDSDSQKHLGTNRDVAYDDTGLPPLVPGYTTHDDLGTDGDDAIHAPLPFHRLPNCIQAEVAFPSGSDASDPETVDLVFFDFIQPFVLQALEMVKIGLGSEGKHYTPSDTDVYVGGKFTDHFAQWIQENWSDSCAR